MKVLGDQSGVNGVRLRSVEGNKHRDLEVTGLFIAIGHHANTGVFRRPAGICATAT